MYPNQDVYKLFTVKDLLELRADPSKWIIPDMLPRVGRVIVYGRGSVYKSTLLFDIAVTVSSGGALLERLPVVRSFGPAVLLSCEGSIYNNRDRLLSHMRSRNVHPESVKLYYGQQSLELRKEEGIRGLEEIIKLVRPALVILDPLLSFYGGNENDSEQMGTFVRGLDELVKRYEFCLVILHHANKGSDIRGSSVLQGWADSIIKIELKRDAEIPSFPDRKDLITVKCEKQRDGRTGTLFSAVPIFDEQLQMITFGIYDTLDAQGVIVAHLRNEILKLMQRTQTMMGPNEVYMAFGTYSRPRVNDALSWLCQTKMVERLSTGRPTPVYRVTPLGTNVDAVRAILRAVSDSEREPDADFVQLG